MPNFLANALCLLFLFSSLTTPTSFGQAPLPQTGQPFVLPITDGTNATAVYLQTATDQACIVYATKNGHLGLLTITTKPNPTPTPTPPPEPPKPVQLSVVTCTETTPAELPAAVKTRLDETRGTYHAFTVAMVGLDEPPTNALRYIGLTAGKSYPYTFLVDVDGKIHWQGPTPATAADFLQILDDTRTMTGPTKKKIAQFRQHLNAEDKTKDHREGRFHQITRKYGDYLWNQDREKFFADLEEWERTQTAAQKTKSAKADLCPSDNCTPTRSRRR